MNLYEQEDFIRHNIFREELYVHAILPKKEFQVKLEEFKKEYAHLLSNKKPVPLDLSGYQLRKYVRGFYK